MALFITLAAWWGGTGYLLNKCFFLSAELASDDEAKRRHRIFSWQVYLAGLLGWLIVFIHKSDFIVFAVELAGLPSMVLGLVYAREHIEDTGKYDALLKRIARASVIMGLLISVWYFGGLTYWSQWCEIGVAAGFLFGTNLLANKRYVGGYAWFLVMNASNAALMQIQGEPVLFVQQVLSFIIIAIALIVRMRNRR